jgi:hypothetical protein
MKIKEVIEKIHSYNFEQNKSVEEDEIEVGTNSIRFIPSILKQHKKYFTDSTWEVPHSEDCNCSIGYPHHEQDTPKE